LKVRPNGDNDIEKRVDMIHDERWCNEFFSCNVSSAADSRVLIYVCVVIIFFTSLFFFHVLSC